MYFEWALRTGMLVLVFTALSSGLEGLPFIAAILVILPLTWAQRRVTDFSHDPDVTRRVHAVVLGFQLAAATGLFCARPVWGTLLLVVSGLLNMVPLLANGLRMPMAGTPIHPCYCEIGPQTRFRWLADIHPTSQSLQGSWLVSIGDAFEVVAVWSMAIHLTVQVVF